MANLFIGLIKDKLTDEIVHSHFAQYADDTFYVEIYDEEGDSIIVGEFRKFHHLEKVVEEAHPNLECISYNAGNVDAEWLINVLKRP